MCPHQSRRRPRTTGYGSHDRDMRVLVAEDDEVLAKAVAVGLRREGMAVDVALDGDDALAHLGGQPLRRGGAGP